MKRVKTYFWVLAFGLGIIPSVGNTQHLINNAQLIIGAGSTLTVKGDFVNSSTGNVTLDPTGIINIGGDLVNDRTGLSLLGTVNFGEDSEHKILGTNQITFQDMSVNTGSWLIIGDANGDGDKVTVNGLLTVEDGSEALFLRNNASLIHHSASVGATFEHYMAGGENDWHLLSSPVGSQSIDPSFVTNGSLYAWHEPALIYVGFGQAAGWPQWTDVNQNHDNFIVGKGYFVAYTVADEFKTFSGSLNQGSVDFAIEASSNAAEELHAFNLAGNPYPSSIDWKAPSGWDRSDLSEASSSAWAYWVWNQTAGNYGTFISDGLDGSGTNGVSRHIAPKQGFWVKAENNGTLGLTNEVRAHSTQEWLKGNEEESNIKLRVSGNSMSYFDEVVLEFNRNVLGGANKMFSIHPKAPSLFFYKDKKYSILRTDVDSETKIALNFKAAYPDLYLITVESLNLSGQTVIMEDLLTGTLTDLSLTGEYHFRGDPQDSEARFLLHFGPVGIDQLSNYFANVYTIDKNVFIKVTDNQDISVDLVDVTGKVLERHAFHGGDLYHFQADYPMGLYLVSITWKTGHEVRKVLIK